MNIEDVEAKVLEELKSGELHINELYRRIGCGKETLLKALSRLQDKGKVEVRRAGNRKVVRRRRVIPHKIALVISTIVASIPLLYLTPFATYTVMYRCGEVQVVTKYPIPLFILSFLMGFWSSAIIFGYEALSKEVSELLEFVKTILRPLKTFIDFRK